MGIDFQDRKTWWNHKSFHKKHGVIKEFSQDKKYIMWNNTLAYKKIEK